MLSILGIYINSKNIIFVLYKDKIEKRIRFYIVVRRISIDNLKPSFEINNQFDSIPDGSISARLNFIIKGR